MKQSELRSDSMSLDVMVTYVPMRFEHAPMLWAVDDIYSADECRRAMDLIERAAPSLVTSNPVYRDQDRVIRDDPAEAERLFVRLRPHLPDTLGPLSLHSLNERLRYYRYRPGQRFSPHMDHWFQPTAARITLLTVLVYFNDDFGGGETRFMEQVERTIVPRQGSVAIFQHKIRHEGCEVRHGTKYAMRTDVIYEASTIEMALDPTHLRR